MPYSKVINPSVRIHAQREEGRGHGLNVEDPVTSLAKSICPFSLHGLRNARSHDGIVESHANEVTLVLGIVDKTVATMEHGKVVDHVDVARHCRKLHLGSTGDSLNGIKSLLLLLIDGRQAGVARVGGGTHQSSSAEVDEEPATLGEDDWAAGKLGERKWPVAGS